MTEKRPTRTEIRITGFGGQGVVLSGHIIGRACAVNAGMHATMIQSFGPEARGSACSTTLAVSDTEVLYPYIGRPDVFVVMSSEGWEKFGNELKDDGTLVYERDLVKVQPKPGQQAFGVSSTRIAEELGRPIVQNIVMLGFFAAVTRIVPVERMREAVRESVPKGTEELNLKAFDAGVAAFDESYAGGAKAAAPAPVGS
ncbi:MAG: 2-oxoacid:acceptor oxidoreductase family protein [Thermoanaerobaculales bacterium]|jgi:2-oxoglutarate ferredoxin oxidoreductase subunit gamma|nr:2-oxoacid:acceptor oxidoreductase family protein [Thermoanaerobaculales bacterium]